MKTINLRDYYPSIHDADYFIEVADEVAEAMCKAEREEHAYYERRRYHRAFYSLNRDDGIESETIRSSPSPEAIFEDELVRGELYAALATLPEKQRRRIYQHYILGISITGIALAEGSAKSSVCENIKRGIQAIEKYLKFFQ